MFETKKTLMTFGDAEKKILEGNGIDIGGGNSPVSSKVRVFDIKDGDANHILKYVTEKFDFVYSSHCLEHMINPIEALHEWWTLVKPGGYMFLVVPDEDLYEQGVMPSRFNLDHKWTFTISKHLSWSPVSINVLPLCMNLPGCGIVNIELQDMNYDRALQTFGHNSKVVDQTMGQALAQIFCLCRKCDN